MWYGTDCIVPYRSMIGTGLGIDHQSLHNMERNRPHEGPQRRCRCKAWYMEHGEHVHCHRSVALSIKEKEWWDLMVWGKGHRYTKWWGKDALIVVILGHLKQKDFGSLVHECVWDLGWMCGIFGPPIARLCNLKSMVTCGIECMQRADELQYGYGLHVESMWA